MQEAENSRLLHNNFRRGIMQKKYTILFITIFITGILYAESLIIPQKLKTYLFLNSLYENGLITSVNKGYFSENAITSYEAASYIIEASNNSESASEKDKQLIAKLEKDFASEIKAIKNGNLETAFSVSAETPEKTSLTVSKIEENLDFAEKELKHTIFNDSSALKVTGEISGRYQELQTFGLGSIHRSSLSGTSLTLHTEGAITSNVSFYTDLRLSSPAFDPFWGTPDTILVYTFGEGNSGKHLAPDIYTLSLGLYGWQITTGFFWEDITKLIASQSESERIGIFERDIYAGEEATRAHFEYIFRNYFQNRDERWSKHQFNGARLLKENVFSKDLFKIAAGKASHDDDYLYEIAAKYTLQKNLPKIKAAKWSLNFYKNFNQLEELAAYPHSKGYDPESVLKDITIFGGDASFDALKLFSFKGEFERSIYNGHLAGAYGGADPPSFIQEGNAYFFHLTPLFLPRDFSVMFKFTYIEPDYVAPASAVSDTNHRTQNISDPQKVDIETITYASDPTSLYNNMNKLEAHAFGKVPNGIFMINYGVSSQIRPTGALFTSKHWLNGSEYWRLLYSNYGYADAGMHKPFIDYNINRYGLDLSGGEWSDKNIVASGLGGLSTVEHESHTEYMVSADVTGSTIKYLANLLVLFRYELNRIFRVGNPFFVELYGELITLSDGANFLASYDPEKMLSQAMGSACIIFGPAKKINLIGFAGIEKWGTNTIIGTPIDYTDSALGFGVDYDLAPRAFLYLRIKRFFHDDVKVPANNFDGWRLWLELKSFF